jgi:hypothetical protein
MMNGPAGQGVNPPEPVLDGPQTCNVCLGARIAGLVVRFEGFNLVSVNRCDYRCPHVAPAAAQ